MPQHNRASGGIIKSRVGYKHLEFGGDEDEEEEDLVLEMPDPRARVN